MSDYRESELRDAYAALQKDRDAWAARAGAAEAEVAQLRKALTEMGVDMSAWDAAVEEANGRAEYAEAMLQHFKDCADTPLMRDVLAERDALRDELAIERERNPNRVVCPKCMANLPCESCSRYSVLRDELEARVAAFEEALRQIAEPNPEAEGDWGATYDWQKSAIVRRDIARAALADKEGT